MLAAPPNAQINADLAPPQLRARYQSVFYLTFPAAAFVAPTLGGVSLQHLGDRHWLIVGGLGLLAALGHLLAGPPGSGTSPRCAGLSTRSRQPPQTAYRPDNRTQSAHHDPKVVVGARRWGRRRRADTHPRKHRPLTPPVQTGGNRPPTVIPPVPSRLVWCADLIDPPLPRTFPNVARCNKASSPGFWIQPRTAVSPVTTGEYPLLRPRPLATAGYPSAIPANTSTVFPIG